MKLYRLTYPDALKEPQECIFWITERCLEIYARRRSLYFVDRYLRRILDGDSYMKLDILERCVKPAISKKYFAMDVFCELYPVKKREL